MEERSLLCNHHCAVSNLYALIPYRSAYEKLWFSPLLYSPALLLLDIRTEGRKWIVQKWPTQTAMKSTQTWGGFSPVLHEVKYPKIYKNERVCVLDFSLSEQREGSRADLNHSWRPPPPPLHTQVSNVLSLLFLVQLWLFLLWQNKAAQTRFSSIEKHQKALWINSVAHKDKYGGASACKKKRKKKKCKMMCQFCLLQCGFVTQLFTLPLE